MKSFQQLRWNLLYNYHDFQPTNLTTEACGAMASKSLIFFVRNEKSAMKC